LDVDQTSLPVFGHRPQLGTAAIGVTSGAPAHPTTYAQPPVARCVHYLMRRNQVRLAYGRRIYPTEDAQRVAPGVHVIPLLTTVIPFADCLS
jgi:hypothetical protein